MKKRILLIVALAAILGLSIAAAAFQNVAGVSDKAKACCCMGDSCPMKSKDGSAAKADSCCDMDDCCCKSGDSCPMMKKGGESADEAKPDGDAKAHAGCSCCGKDKHA